MNKYFVLLDMESIYHIVAIHVNETSWAHVWRLRFRYLGTGYDTWVVTSVDAPCCFSGLGQVGPSRCWRRIVQQRFAAP
jgi:hypothetical protein